MPAVRPCELPAHALLRRHLEGGGYADGYVTEVALPVSQAHYVEAFYTTWLFKLERRLLAWFVNKPSTDEGARELAGGSRSDFAAWHVEACEPAQLLMADFMGRTRSWLMCEAAGDGAATRLYFGSAVLPITDRRTGERTMSRGFRLLLGFHKLYSRALLAAAARRVVRRADLAAARA